MEPLGNRKIWTYLDGHQNLQGTTSRAVRRDRGHRVGSYLELASKIAAIQYRNPEFVLLFRGQDHDYPTTKGNSSLLATIFRNAKKRIDDADSNYLSPDQRFELLKKAEELLLKEVHDRDLPERRRLRFFPVLRWAILQHYNICDTPLLDFTQSLRIAASFGSDKPATTAAFVFVVGVPNLSGIITVSAEGTLQIVRLSSACPPAALRPHIQEGFLLGEYPDIGSITRRAGYRPYELDAARRLIAKFWFHPGQFWSEDDAFPRVQSRALYPEADPILEMATKLDKELKTYRQTKFGVGE